MTGRNIIIRLTRTPYFQEDKFFKKRGGRINTKHYSKLAKSRLKAIFKQEIKRITDEEI